MSDPQQRLGITAGLFAFMVWGLMPLYWHLLKSVPSLLIIAHRISWGALMVGAWLFWKHGRHWFGNVIAQPRLAGLLLLSSVCVGFNWGMYIWAVNNGHVVESSLGYFINPLLNVVFGTLFLRERFRPLQCLAIAIATAGVLWLTFNYGKLPWIALSLAGSFALYGLLRKVIAIDSVTGLGVESAYLLLPALALIGWGQWHGQDNFMRAWPLHIDLLLIVSGALTAVPMALFAYAVRRVPLSTVGMMQYIAPTLQFLCGVLYFREPFDQTRAIGFVIIWIALAIFAISSIRRV